MSVFFILVVIALILAVVSIVKPFPHMLAIAVILISVALLLSRQGF